MRKGQKSTAKPLENHVNETREKKVLYQDWQTKNKAWLAKQDSRALQWLTTEIFLKFRRSILDYEIKFWTSKCFVSVPSLTDSCSTIVHMMK